MDIQQKGNSILITEVDEKPIKIPSQMYPLTGQLCVVRHDNTEPFPDGEETARIANDKFAYRLVLTDTNVNDQWSLKLTLKDRETGKTYTLTYDRPNLVTFVFRTLEGETVQDTELKVLRVPQGSTIQDAYPDITEDSLSLELSDKSDLPKLEPGYHWTWKLPEGKILKDVRVPQTEEPISYNVKYDPNYPSGFGLDAPMEDSLFT